jgi:hypothetical protein
MRTTIKACFTVALSLLILLDGFSAFAISHRYDTGTLASIGDKEIIMAGKVYRLTPKVKVIFKIKEKGAYYKHIGQLTDLRAGEKAYLKVQGNKTVLEIEVMR